MATAIISTGPQRQGCGCPAYTARPRGPRKRLTARKRARLLRDAKAMLAPFGLDWSRYDAPVIQGYDDCPHQDGVVLGVTWRLLSDMDGTGVTLSNVWWHEDTGAILQCGENSGSLVY